MPSSSISDKSRIWRSRVLILWLWAIFASPFTAEKLVWAAAPTEKEISLAMIGADPVRLKPEPANASEFTWWFPAGFDAVVAPISAGVIVDRSQTNLMQWLRDGSPWSLSELPVLGVRYGSRTAVVIVPWPQYAEMVIAERVGVRFSYPKNRETAVPSELVAVWRGTDPLEAARAFREWRQSATNTGAIPRPRRLAEKSARLPRVSWLYGAPHIYLWGSALFSRHDVDRAKWLGFARYLRDAPAETLAGRVAARFSRDQRDAVKKLAESEAPFDYLTRDVAAGLENALTGPSLLNSALSTSPFESLDRNREATAKEFREFVHEPSTWGDGPSMPILEGLHTAGLDHALLLLSDLEQRSPRPDLAKRAAELGYLFGPYDSYHSVHSPDAPPEETWETAQFDQAAYADGRVLNAVARLVLPWS